MKRIMVIGSCGAGKSTLSRKLHSILGIELVHLDQHYWKPNWVESERSEWEDTVKQLVKKEQWIIDGNYGGTMDIRLARADTVIFLNYATSVCLFRVMKRIIKNHGKVRPDMPEGCRERFDLSFLHYVAVFRLTRSRSILEKLKKEEKAKSVFVFENDRQTENFIRKLELENGKV